MHGGHNTFGAFAYEDATAVASEEVPLETLDALAERLAVGRVDVIKIDVEGAELKVLTGRPRRCSATSRPILLIEANDAALRGQSASTAALLELLRELDYEIHVFSDAPARSNASPRAAPCPPTSWRFPLKPAVTPRRRVLRPRKFLLSWHGLSELLINNTNSNSHCLRTAAPLAGCRPRHHRTAASRPALNMSGPGAVP